MDGLGQGRLVDDGDERLDDALLAIGEHEQIDQRAEPTLAPLRERRGRVEFEQDLGVVLADVAEGGAAGLPGEAEGECRPWT